MYIFGTDSLQISFFLYFFYIKIVTDEALRYKFSMIAYILLFIILSPHTYMYYAQKYNFTPEHIIESVGNKVVKQWKFIKIE